MRARSLLYVMFKLFRRKSSPGDVYLNEDAIRVKSTPGGDLCKVVFRNRLDDTMMLCWMDEKGRPHHFYRLIPTDVVDSEEVTEMDRVEHAHTCHVFVLATASDIEACRQAKSLDYATILAAYRPTQSGIHVVDIELCTPAWDPTDFCRPRLRKRSRRPSVQLRVRTGRFDSTPIDTTCKPYTDQIICGWKCKLEADWHGGDKELEKVLHDDLAYATEHLPPHARQRLQTSTIFWINKSLKYGPKACPTKGKGLCYHPGKDWLVRMGCHPAKAQCIELYDSKNYQKDHQLWGTGGVMLHELSHAYHHQCLPDGYQNKEILACYQRAMRDKLYEQVQVHGPQGPTARAYACQDAMEYWAELSTAFLGGIHRNEREEYNKWYPFTRRQVQEHDPRAFTLLSSLWQVDVS